jgi:hypothetical protein
MRNRKKIVITLLLCILPSLTYSIEIFGDDKDILWQSGVNLYIKFGKQDKSAGGKTLPNSHPVELDAKEITDALSAIEYWEKEGFFKDAEANTVFSVSQNRLLGNYLSLGLAKAKPGQDILFVLSYLKKGALGFKDKLFVAGRAFYLDNRLHIIIGDYDRPVDKGKEAVEGGAGITEVQYFFTTGSRSDASKFKKSLVTGNGVDLYYKGNKRRRDWFVIDVPVAAAAYVAKNEKKDKPSAADSEALRQEAARMAQERREMRAEMARMRKEMSESRGDRETLTPEERLSELEELHKKGLISDAEYEQKRKEILDDI